MFSHLLLASSETLHCFHTSILPEVTDHTKPTETGNQTSWVHYKTQKPASSTHLFLASSVLQIQCGSSFWKALKNLIPNFIWAFVLQTTEMKKARLFLLLSSIWSGGFGLSDTTQTSEDENSKNMTAALVPLNKIQSLQMLSTTQIMSTETATTPEARTSEESLLKLALLRSETSPSPEGVKNPTIASTERTEKGVLKFQALLFPTKSSIKFSPRAESVVLSNSTLKFLQSFARKSNQQVISLNSVGRVENRSPRETYLNRGDSSKSQRTNYQKSSFETTRGK